MHDYTMKCIGEYIKEHYCPTTMTRCDLEELYYWSKVMKNLLEADKDYNIVVSMESHNDINDIDMTVDEMIPRFKKLYHESSSSQRSMLKEKIMDAME